jgi:hypothetical protein
MFKQPKRSISLLLTLFFIFTPLSLTAGDHRDAPATTDDPSADLADLFAWHEGNVLNTILTFAADSSPGEAPSWDPNVLYGVHLDLNNNNIADLDIWVRFGQNDLGDWGIQITGLPGATQWVTVGPIDRSIDAGNGLLVWAGLADDPFFFDEEGFQNTIDSGVFMISEHDSRAGKNAMAIVMQMDLSLLSEEFRIWATTGRL